MSRPNSYGSKAAKARRKAVADANAAKALFTCKKCATIHRRDRECAG